MVLFQSEMPDVGFGYAKYSDDDSLSFIGNSSDIHRWYDGWFFTDFINQTKFLGGYIISNSDRIRTDQN